MFESLTLDPISLRTFAIQIFLAAEFYDFYQNFIYTLQNKIFLNIDYLNFNIFWKIILVCTTHN